MRLAVLPFNAAEGTKPSYGRQFAAFAAEQVRVHGNADINAVSFLTQVQDQDGSLKTAFINIADDLLPYDQIKELFCQAEVDLVQDGMLKQDGDSFDLTVRYFGPDSEEPVYQENWQFAKGDIFTTLHRLVKLLGRQAKATLSDEVGGDSMPYGTDNSEAFLEFLNGFDGLSYVNQANGQVASVFDPQESINSLLKAMELDPSFDAAYHVLVQFCRACANFRVGNFEMMDVALKKALEAKPDEWGAYFALGELHQMVGSLNTASDLLEKAVQLNPEDAGLLSRLALVQLQLGMPVNAERNLRKAMSLEDDSKPSADMLAMVLQQMGRGHEIPGLWKSLIDANPDNAAAASKYAMSLIQSGREDEGVKEFEKALELDNNSVVKRFYAPYLAGKGEHDRAMDFYEDVLDEAPNDVPVLLEYAQTLEAAGREFEVPRVLKDVLSSNPDQNTRAQALARLIELEQPKRVESVEAAREKMEAGDFAAAISQLKPLRNWLADYWKMWALVASAYNHTEQFAEAQEATEKLLELFPGCEPAYGEYVAALTGQGKTEDAYQFMRFAAQQNPQSLSIHVNLALAAKRAGHEDEARELGKQIREAVGPNEELEPILAEIEG